MTTNQSSTWCKEPAIEGANRTFPPSSIIAVGFGYAALHRDGTPVYEESDVETNDYMTGAQAEMIAASNPDHDWRIVLEGPLASREYQRHGPNEWVLIRRDEGFA